MSLSKWGRCWLFLSGRYFPSRYVTALLLASDLLRTSELLDWRSNTIVSVIALHQSNDCSS